MNIGGGEIILLAIIVSVIFFVLKAAKKEPEKNPVKFIKGICHHCDFETYIPQKCNGCGSSISRVAESKNGGWGIFCEGCRAGFSNWVCQGCKNTINVSVDYRREKYPLVSEMKNLKNAKFVSIPTDELSSTGYPKN